MCGATYLAPWLNGVLGWQGLGTTAVRYTYILVCIINTLISRIIAWLQPESEGLRLAMITMHSARVSPKLSQDTVVETSLHYVPSGIQNSS